MQITKDIKKQMAHIQKLTEMKTHPNTIKLFRAIIALWVVVNTLILIPAADQFYSLSSHIPLQDVKDYGFYTIIHILNVPEYTSFYPMFIVGQLLAALFAGLSIAPRLSSLALCFFTLNLDNRAFVILDGGNNLVHLFLIYLIFASPKQNTALPTLWGATDNLISNLSLYMCRIQVVIVYATAGLLKLAGPLWTKGIALYYTMSVLEYGSPLVANLMSQFPLLIVIATYGTVVFQASFPYMIWNRQARPIYMAIGTLLHLQISFVMGLFMFGFAMCASYFCFYTDEQSKNILNVFSRLKPHVHKQLKERLYANI